MEATQEAQATAAPAIEAVKEDPWEGAEDAFNDAIPDETKAEVKAEESHLEPEAEVPDYLKLDDLRIAHKYKPVVEERIKQIVSGLEEKQKTAIEAATQELGQNKEAVVSLVNIFRDIAQTPREQVAQKIAGLIENYGQHLGIDPSTAQSLRAQEAQREIQQEPPVTIDAITRKYRDRMIQTQDPNEFMSLWEQADVEKSQAMETQVLGKVGQLLKLYHDKYIEPDKATLKEFKSKAEQDAATATYNSKKTSWNEAANGLKSKYEDFEKYKPQISKMIKEKKDLSAARDRLNEDLDDVESRQDFLERVYLALSRNDHIENAKKPRQGGLPPSQKHIQTTKASGGGSWDSAYENTKHLWE